MLPSPRARRSCSAKPGIPAHGTAPSKSNMATITLVTHADEPFFSVLQVAGFLNISRLTVYRLVERGLLPVYRIARRLRFARSDIERYLTTVRSHIDYGDAKD